MRIAWAVIWAIAIAVTIGSTLTSAYTIEGDSVKYSGQYADLTVTPHTSYSPANQQQTFTVYAKASGSLCVAYVFGMPLSNADVLLQKTGSYEQDIYCDNILANGTNRPYVCDTETAYYTYYDSVKEYFDYLQHNGKHIYYSEMPLYFNVGQSRSWRIDYTPNPADTSKKWDLVAWNSQTGDCRLDYINGDYNFNYVLDPWWNTSYSKKQEITLNTSITADYQILLNITYDADMQADFDDIMILNAGENTTASFWIESKVDSSYANVWVKMPETSDTLYLYYGNAAATSASNGTNTFIQWFGELHVDTIKPVIADYLNPYVLEAKVSFSGNHNCFWGIAEAVTRVGDHQIIELYYSSNRRHYASQNEASKTEKEDNDAIAPPTRIMLVFNGSSLCGYENNDLIQGACITTNLPNDNMGLFMDDYAGTCGQNWSFTRKYLSYLPSAGYGAEESANYAPIVNTSISPATLYTDTTANCSSTYVDPNGDNGNVTFNWYVAGVSVKNETWNNVTNSSSQWSILTGGNFSKGQNVTCNVTAVDDIGLTGDTVVASKIVVNTAPTAPDLFIPADGTRNTVNWIILNCTNSTDVDGDNISYSYAVDIVTPPVLEYGVYNTTYNYSTTDSNLYYWRCRAYDGADYSTYSTAIWNFTENSPPTGTVTILPTAPSIDDDLTCNPSLNDAEGDTIHYYEYDWYEASLGWLGLNDSTLSSTLTSAGQTWTCKLSAGDGYENATFTSSAVTLAYGCVADRGFTISVTGSGDYTLLNFSSMPQYVRANLSNVDAGSEQAWLKADYALLINTTMSTAITVYINSYLTDAAHTPTAIAASSTLNLTTANLTRDTSVYPLTWRTEESPTDLWNMSDAAGFRLFVYCPNMGASEIDILNAEQGFVLVTKEQPLLMSNHITFASNDSYFRNYVPYTENEEVDFYMIDLDAYTAVLNTFDLVDLTGEFTHGVMRFKKHINGSLEDMSSDFFGMDNKMFAYFIENTRYYVTVYSEDGSDERQLGWFTVISVDTDRQVILSQLIYDDVIEQVYDFVDVGFTWNYNTSQICLVYDDSVNETINVSFYVYAADRTLLYNTTSTADSCSLCYNVPNQNLSYIVRGVFNHPRASEVDFTRVINMLSGIRKLIDPEMPAQILGLSSTNAYNLMSIVLIVCTGFAFMLINASIGGIIMVLMAMFLQYIMWIDVGWGLLVGMLAVTVLAHMGQNRGVG